MMNIYDYREEFRKLKGVVINRKGVYEYKSFQLHFDDFFKEINIKNTTTGKCAELSYDTLLKKGLPFFIAYLDGLHRTVLIDSI